MTEFISGIQDFLVSLGFVILGYFFCKYRQKSKQAHSTTKQTNDNEPTNDVEANMKRLEKNIAPLCLVAAFWLHNSEANNVVQNAIYIFLAILVCVDAWERNKIIKGLRSRYTEFSNKSSDPTWWPVQ
jgi:phosphate/sulfate permease